MCPVIMSVCRAAGQARCMCRNLPAQVKRFVADLDLASIQVAEAAARSDQPALHLPRRDRAGPGCTGQDAVH